MSNDPLMPWTERKEESEGRKEGWKEGMEGKKGWKGWKERREGRKGRKEEREGRRVYMKTYLTH